MRKVLFLYNTASGRGRIAQQVDRIVDIFTTHEWIVTPELINFQRNPFDDHLDIERVVVAGGDGSVNYVVNCMYERGLQLEIGILPVGTANDFAGVVGMSHDPLKAALQIATGHIEEFDCGRVNGLYFINIFSFGIFTTTSQRTPDERKHRMGKLAYILEGIKELRRMHAIPLTIQTSQDRFHINALMALIFNGETAGGFHLTKGSSIRDGLFDCLLLEKRNFFVSCWAMLRYLCGGHPSSVRHLRTSSLRITSTLDEPTDVDGQKGEHFPLEINCLHKSLRVVCPQEQNQSETR
jgi:YegS/Rv2252/BmrU family lipid kinase